MSAPENHPRVELQAPSSALLRLFLFYLKWYLPRHFHAVRMARGARLPETTVPVVVYVNHASWWDPLICLVLAHRLFPDRNHYAPMDAAALERYPLLKRMGFFPVEQHSTRGAAQFLRAASEVLGARGAMLWLTPQGAFTDPRQRPIVMKSGLAALLKMNPHVVAMPLAIEYTFWDERLPEVLIQTGVQQRSNESASREAIHESLIQQLTSAQDELAVLAIARRAEPFDVLMRGGAGVGFVYNTLRRVRALFQGQPYRAEHGGIAQQVTADENADGAAESPVNTPIKNPVLVNEQRP